MTDLLHRNARSVKVHNDCPKNPPSTPTHFATPLSRWRVVRLSRPPPLFAQAAASKLRASQQFVSCIHLSFVNFSVHLNPQTKNYRGRFGDSKCCNSTFVCPYIAGITVNDDQQNATILTYLFIPNQLYKFRAMSSPIIRST